MNIQDCQGFAESISFESDVFSFGFDIKSTGNKSQKKSKWNYIILKRFCKENSEQNVKAIYGTGENICKPYM